MRSAVFFLALSAFFSPTTNAQDDLRKPLQTASDVCKAILKDKDFKWALSSSDNFILSEKFEENRKKNVITERKSAEALRQELHEGIKSRVQYYKNRYSRGILPLKRKLAELQKEEAQGKDRASEIEATVNLIVTVEDHLQSELILNPVRRDGETAVLSRVEVQGSKMVLKRLVLILDEDKIVDYIFSETNLQDESQPVKISTDPIISEAYFKGRSPDRNWTTHRVSFVAELDHPDLSDLDISDDVVPGANFEGLIGERRVNLEASILDTVNRQVAKERMRKRCEIVFKDFPKTLTGQRDYIPPFWPTHFGVEGRLIRSYGGLMNWTPQIRVQDTLPPLLRNGWRVKTGKFPHFDFGPSAGKEGKK